MLLRTKKSLLGLLALLCVMLFAVVGAVSFVQSNQTAYANSTNAETIDFGTDGITDAAKVQELITVIDSTATSYDDLSTKLGSNVKDASNFTSAKTVTLGGVAFNIMYVSKADYTANGTTAGDVIVTLWQADADSGSDYDSQFNTWYENNTDYAYPSTMYGSSLIRSVLMDKNDAERKYVKTENASELTAYNSSDDKYNDKLEARWAPFKDSDGVFNGYLATPANMAWQETQWLSSINISFYCPNDAWDASKLASKFSRASWYSRDGINIGDMKDKLTYSDWKNDKVWLPSVTETGNIENKSGLWKTNPMQRENTNSKGVWLRSGRVGNAGNAWYLNSSGGGSDYGTSSPYAVRPAIHLNLSKVVDGLKSATCEFPSKTDWKKAFDNSSGLPNRANITEITFAKTAPDGYEDSGETLNTNIQIWKKDDTKIAFVYDGTITAPKNSFNLFGITVLNKITFENFSTADVTDMSSMFYGCSSLISLDLSGFDTADVTDMSNMFYGCSNLISLDLSNFDATQVTDMESMFGARSLNSIKVSQSLAQKLSTTDYTYLYHGSHLTWYGEDGKAYTDTNRFSTAGTYTTVQPPFEVTVDSAKTYYNTLFDAWDYANTQPFATVKMFADAEVSSTLEVSAGKNITLDLNGKKLAYTGADGSVIKIDGTFTLEDKGTGTHIITSPVTNEDVAVSGGLITGGKGTVVSSRLFGGAVFVGTGVFTMNGGTLAGNTARTGGGVYNNGTFTMNGGRITCNMAGEGLGGGVYNNGTFSVSGAPEITGNTANGNVCNVTLNQRITFAGELTDGAKIGVRSGMVATGYAQSDKPGKYFIPDDSANDCVYAKEGNVTIGKHTGGTATCVSAKTCANCGEEYGEVDSTKHLLDKLVIVSATNKYSAFDAFDTQTAEVYTHCSACSQNIDTLAAIDITVTYSNGNCLHADDTHVLVSANVGGQTLYSDEYSVTVNKCNVTVIWEYTTSEVSTENAWEWNEITEGSHFVYDGTSKSYRVRARFTGADNDPDKDTYYYRAVDNTLLVDGSGEKGIENAAVYELSLDGSQFADYSFTNNSISIEVKPYEIKLSDAEVYRWTLGSDKGSLLRNAYIEKTADDVYLYYDPITGNAEGRTYVMRSVVRYRGENTGLNIVLNGGEIADLFAGAGKRSNVEYSGTTAVGAIGKYTAIATLTLNDVSNYRYVGEITVADSRGMTIVISENGTKAIITKDWYVATIKNGLLMPDGGEYSVSGWVFGEDFMASVPKLEHGDESFDLNNISESDKRISFGLSTDVDMTEMIGETFYRYNFADYVNKSMPSGNYVLRVSVSEVTDLDGLAYQAFTRTFTFSVKKGTLVVTDTLNGKEFEYIYNGKVQLFESQFEPTVASPKYVSAEDRMGIWQNGEYDKYYAAAYMTFHLARWQTAGGIGYEFVTRTQLENTLDRKQAPREVDTYTVQYKISALNYEDYGGSTGFTVKITRRQVAVPTNVTETLIKEYVYEIPENADYRIEGNATFTQSGTHTVTLKLIDADNYEWVAGDNVEGNTATVTVTLIMHDHVYGEWEVDIEPTCTEAGSRSKKCTLCGDVAEEQVGVLGHNLTQHEAKPATCTEKGWSAYETCSRCNHTTYKETAALGHNLTHVEHKKATAASAGNIEYWACADCTEYFSDAGGETVITDKSSVEIPMLITEDNDAKGLSAGAVAGIVIACVIVVLVAAYVAGYFLLYRKGILLKGKAFDAIYVPMNAIFNKIEE